MKTSFDRARPVRVRMLCAAGFLALAGCGSPPPSPIGAAAEEEASVPVHTPTSPAAFEQKLRERALGQGRRGHLAEAATSWEILTVLRPESAEYRDRLEETRRLIDATVPERMQRGAQALKRGELDAATSHYLAALALQPDNLQAADALRGIERERNRRNYLGKSARTTITRRAINEAQATAAAPGNPDRNAIEHATLLAGQGEYDDAIVLLERQLAADKRDVAACQLLSEVYFQKAEKLLPRDRGGAVAAYERSVRVDAANTRAAARLKQLKPSGTAAALANVAAREGCNAAR